MDAVEKLNALLPEIEPEKYGELPDIELYMDQPSNTFRAAPCP